MFKRPRYYRLIGRLPVPMRDIYLYDRRGRLIGISPDKDIQKEWTDAWAAVRIVAKTEVGPMHVSTVFLVLDHCYSLDSDEPPVLFETMIFGADPDDSYQERYSTWDEAEKGHARAVAFAEGLLAKANAMLETSPKEK